MWTMLGAVSAFLSVAAGAFGAHGLKDHLAPDLLGTFEVAARYQMYHALALVATGLLAGRADATCLRIAGWAFVIGTLLFSGSLYALSLTAVRGFGAVAPLGGAAFMIGWLTLAWAARPRVFRAG